MEAVGGGCEAARTKRLGEEGPFGTHQEELVWAVWVGLKVGLRLGLLRFSGGEG